jgi:predicted GNAT family N-acyltransferase
MVEIRVITSHETLLLRSQVLRSGRPVEDAVLPGDEDAETLHLGAFDNDAIVGVASLFHEPLPGDTDAGAWRLRGMAVSPATQGRGYGKALLLCCLDHVAKQGGIVLWCNARTAAKGFYLSCGFQVQGEEFEIPGIGPHFVMLRCINRKSQ